MSAAQTVQILITLLGIALAVTLFLAGPFGMLVNGLLAFLVFVAAGAAAGVAYALLSSRTRG